MSKKLLTTEDLERLEAELQELIQVKKPEIIKQLQEARAQGDLSENADYDAAKNEQAQIEKRILEINEILNNYELISNKNYSSDGTVKIQSTVKILDIAENKEYIFQILGSEGSDPKNGKISNDSPLAKSILEKKVGDIVEVKGIENSYKIKIISIE